MAHIPDGILSLPVVAGGAVACGAALWVSLRRLASEKVPHAAVLGAAFFVSSTISFPVGPSSVHLMLSCVMGILLGSAVIPALFVALLLQSIFFGLGGLLALGVNTINIAVPALFAGSAFYWLKGRVSENARALLAAPLAAMAVISTGALVFFSLLLSGSEYLPAAAVMMATYLPLALLEAVIAVVIIRFLMKVAPEWLD